MPRESPIVLKLPPGLLTCANPWFLILNKELGYTASEASLIAEKFVFKSDEKPFVKELFARKSNLWVFRCDQRRFCGDFVVVAMSSPERALRRVAVLELKRGARLKRGGGGAGVQLKNAALAVAALARDEIVAEDADYELLSGDRAELLREIAGW
jgi:hypothetical protein